jgi:diguanylate cyclase (GGDEF)-like protein
MEDCLVVVSARFVASAGQVSAFPWVIPVAVESGGILASYARPMRVVGVSLLAGQRLFTLGAAIVCMMVGASVLAIWLFDPALLPNTGGGQPIMRAMTALCFVMSGLSLLLFQVSAVHRAAMSKAACGLAVVLTVLGSVTLSQDMLGWGASIGDGVQKAVAQNADESSGLMSGAAALVFILIGSAMVMMLRQGRVLWLGQSLAASGFLISLLSLLADLFGADVDRVIPFSSMTAYAAVVFLVLGAGVLMLRGGQGWISEFFQDTPSAKAGRLYLVSTIVALPLIAQLSIVGERDLDWYDTYFGFAILTVGSIAVLSFLNWMAVRLGNANDRQIDNMLRVNRTLSGINTLIVRVREKDELFRESCRIAVENGQFPCAWIATTAPDSPRLVMQAWHGGDNSLREDLDGLLEGGSDAGAGLLQQVVRSAEPLNVASLPLHRTSLPRELLSLTVLRRAGMQSMVVLPLIDAGRVAGLMGLYSEHAGFFDSREMHLLNDLAGDIAFAIGHIEKEATLNYLAYYDSLTGLPNRTLFMERLGRELNRAAKQDDVVALVVGNVQRFRIVNETFGRHVGDDLLRELATRLAQTSPFPENLSRINADSFACFMPCDEALAVGHHVQSMFEGALAQPFRFGGQLVTVEVTVAASVFPFDGVDGETLMTNAETALRKAKATQSPFMFYEAAMNARVAETFKLERQ